MERIPIIKKEVTEKKGRDFMGLQQATEIHLEELVRYMDHPKIYENPKKLEEILDLYDKAKTSGFIQMTGIINKLQQYNVTIGKSSTLEIKDGKSASQRAEMVNIERAIDELKADIEVLLTSATGKSLPDKTHKSLVSLLNYLGHPKLPTKADLFQNLRDKYNEVKSNDFINMQQFFDSVDMLEIKLGPVTDEMRTFKTSDELKKELETQKTVLKTLIEEMDEERETFNSERQEFEEEVKRLEEEKDKISKEQLNLKLAKERAEVNIEKLEQEKKQLDSELAQLKEEVAKLKEENTILKATTQSTI